jgi:hypothetical protein
MVVFDDKQMVANDVGYIKLDKNTKGYNWEIKAYDNMDEKKMLDLIEKINRINGVLLNYYGNSI